SLAGRAVLTLSLATLLLSSSSFVHAQGVINAPQPTPPGYHTPGCMITFNSGNWPDGPDRPCAQKCSDSHRTPREELKAHCGGAGGLGTYEWGAYHPDQPDRVFPPGLAPEGSYTCLTLVGPPGLPNGTAYFPKGHPVCGGVSGDPHLT